MGVAASKMKVRLPDDRAVDAEVDLGTNEGYLSSARLNVKLPGLEREVAQAVVDAAHQIRPRGDIDVAITSFRCITETTDGQAKAQSLACPAPRRLTSGEWCPIRPPSLRGRRTSCSGSRRCGLCFRSPARRGP